MTDDYHLRLAGVDGERVWVSRAYNLSYNGIAIRQLRETFFGLEGVISLLYMDHHYQQWSVSEEWWERFWQLACGEPVDYFARLYTLVERIKTESSSTLVHEAKQDYRTRFGQPFYPTNFSIKKSGAYVGEKPHIKDRSYVRFMFRPGYPPAIEQFTPDVLEENRVWRERQLEARSL